RKMQLHVPLLCLGPIVDNVVESLKPAAESKSIHINKIIDVHAGPVSGDSQRLQQIAWNLISNAVKFTPRGGNVQVTVQQLDSRVVFRVADSGIGLDPSFVS